MTMTSLVRADAWRTLLRRMMVLTALSISMVALAQPADPTSEFQFNIAPQPLAQALLAFSAETGMQVAMSDVPLPAGASASVIGRHTAIEAIQQLLSGSGLQYELIGNTIAIEPSAAASPPPPASPPARQTPPPQPALEEQGSFEEVVVTARRRAENIQSVPVAITALSAEQLASNGISDVEDLRFFAPSFQMSPSPFGATVPGIAIRGQRQLEGLITLDPSVGIYFADVVQMRPHGSNSTLYDVDSVQVLKGPQGTLFGRNTTGGAMLVSPAKPVIGLSEGSVGVNFGDYKLFSSTTAINIPVSETFAMRFAVHTSHHDGYTRDLADGQDVDDEGIESARLSALWQPSDELSSYTVFQSFNSRNNGGGYRLREINPSGSISNFPGTVEALQSVFAELQDSDWHTVINDQDNLETTKTRHVSNTTEWEFAPDVSVKNIIGYREVDNFARFDFDGSDVILTLDGAGEPITLFNSQNSLAAHQFSNELQLLGKALDQQLDWITGAYYFREKGDDDQLSDLFGRRRNHGIGTNESYSVFAQGSYRFSRIEGLSLTLGARQTWDRRKLVNLNQIQSISQSELQCRLVEEDGITPLDPCRRTTRYDDSAPTWQITLDYQVNPNLLTYLAHRHGYRSGGLQLRATKPYEPQTFDPEFVDDFEVGIKSTFDIGRVPVRLNASAYSQKYEDIQRTLSLPDPNLAGGLISTTLNAASATIQGGELELSVLPTAALELVGFLSLTDASYDEFVNPSTGDDYSDNDFSFIPKTTAGATIRYQLPTSGELGQFYAQGNWYRQSSMAVNDIASGAADIAGYDLFNASFEWNQITERPFDARLYVRNLTDEEYVNGVVDSYTVGFNSAYLGAPRTIGLEMTYRFGE